MNARACPWRTVFLCAAFETGGAKMPVGISKAKASIEARLAALPQPDRVECRVVEDAQRSLGTRGRPRQCFGLTGISQYATVLNTTLNASRADVHGRLGVCGAPQALFQIILGKKNWGVRWTP
jgi:hypothetical protein